ncbi:MAG: ABC transporter substrate-binding protein [Candidatus Dormibacteraeota bacterium]|nr:ABC transporter substrate-binding protein [Candidatus Dormibacteraeota bacterium]
MGRRDVSENDFSNFEDFLDAWSRRDFLRGMGGSLAFTTFLAGGMELLAACGGGNSGTQTNTQNAKRGGHVVEGNPTDIANLNPLYINDVYSQTIAYRLYDALLSIDNQANLLPNLATDVPKVSSDGLSYTFKLHKGVQWSDGQPLTADDVAFTYQLMYAPEWKGAKARYRPQAEQYIQSVTAADPQTVVIKTTKVFAPFLITFCTGTSGTGGILPKHVWEKLRPEAMPSSEMNNLPTVVSGAMAPVKWDKGSQYVIKRNDNWFRGKTYIDQHVFKVTPSFVANANLLKTGEIDIGVVDNSVWDDLGNSQSVNRVGFTRPSYDYYLHNLDASKTPKAAIFGDSQVRKALYTALDKKKIADKVYFGQATPADSIMSSAQWAHTTPKTQYPYDLAKANKILDDAGWKKGPDGIRSKGGVKMEWELRTNAGNAVRETLITVLADQWKQIGANVATKPVQFPQLVTQLSQTRDFEMILLGISENADPDQTQYYKSTSIGNGALNGSGYKNPEIDSLLDEGVQTVDRNKRKDVYAKIQDILMQDLPTPLVTYPKGLWGISKRVQNFGVGPWNQYGARPWYKDVYVSDGK